MKVESAKQREEKSEREREGYRELKVAERVSFHREKERKTSDNFSKSNTTRAAQVANQGRRMQRERGK